MHERCADACRDGTASAPAGKARAISDQDAHDADHRKHNRDAHGIDHHVDNVDVELDASTTPAFSAAPLTPAPAVSSAQSGTSGFAYLGVPHSTPASVPAAHQTSKATPRGGAFSP